MAVPQLVSGIIAATIGAAKQARSFLKRSIAPELVPLFPKWR